MDAQTGRGVGSTLPVPPSQGVAGGRECPFSGRRRAEPVARFVVGLDDEDATARTHQRRKRPDRRCRVGQVLQDADAEHGVGAARGHRQRAQVTGQRPDPCVDLTGEVTRVTGPGGMEIDRDHLEARGRQGQGHVDLAVAAADMDQPLTGSQRRWLLTQCVQRVVHQRSRRCLRVYEVRASMSRDMAITDLAGRAEFRDTASAARARATAGRRELTGVRSKVRVLPWH